MAKPKTRSEKAGEKLGNSIIEVINLMYQNNTAKNFYKGLINTLKKDLNCRKLEGLLK